MKKAKGVVARPPIVSPRGMAAVVSHGPSLKILFLLLTGFFATATVPNAKGDYFQNFNTAPGWREWAVNSLGGMYWTTFQGDGVFRIQPQFDTLSPTNYALTSCAHNGGPFSFAWDVYYDAQAGSTIPTFGIEVCHAIATLNGYMVGENIGGMFDKANNQVQAGGANVQSSSTPVACNFSNRWLHNRLDYQNGIISLNVYDGKGNTTNLIGSHSAQKASLGATNKIGFVATISGGWVGPFQPFDDPIYSVVYLDNLDFRAVPEPMTLGLLAMGVLGVLRRRV